MPRYPGLSQPDDILIIFPDNIKIFKNSIEFFQSGVSLYQIEKYYNLEDGYLVDPITSFHYKYNNFYPLNSGVYLYKPNLKYSKLKSIFKRIKIFLTKDKSQYENLKYSGYKYTHIQKTDEHLIIKTPIATYKYDYNDKKFYWKYNGIDYEYSLNSKILRWKEDDKNVYIVKNIIADKK